MYWILFLVFLFVGYQLVKVYFSKKEVLKMGLEMVNKLMEQHRPAETARKIGNSILIEYIYEGQRYETLIPFSEDRVVDMINVDFKLVDRTVKIQPGTAIRVTPNEVGSLIHAVNSLTDTTVAYHENQQPNFLELSY